MKSNSVSELWRILILLVTMLIIVMVFKDKYMWQSKQVEPLISYSDNPYKSIAKGDVSWLRRSIDLFDRLELEPGQTKCRKLVDIGGAICDGKPFGMKYLCLDADVAIDNKNCVAHSYGVNGDISFDKKIANYGCQVFMMDPTLPEGSYDWVDGRLTFLPFGLGDKNMMLVDPKNGRSLPFVVFDEFPIITGYFGPIHYLKIDIEMEEWRSLEYILDNNLLVGVKQLMVEFHFFIPESSAHRAVDFYKERWLFLERFEDHGFLRVRYDVTYSGAAYLKMPDTNDTAFICGELFLIRRSRSKQ
ncbi:uncharacterized protein LOC108683465 [Hyalella azteca]|uniref:Uncharacterized protein LOC108683465 n=1 Tax=Hyalella azteca TaxID=294128 RepID=A0A8B7PPY3_HYAAZ|nr:uncharacterized protein LOC108683465 [Hyalella azteca]